MKYLSCNFTVTSHIILINYIPYGEKNVEKGLKSLKSLKLNPCLFSGRYTMKIRYNKTNIEILTLNDYIDIDIIDIFYVFMLHVRDNRT